MFCRNVKTEELLRGGLSTDTRITHTPYEFTTTRLWTVGTLVALFDLLAQPSILLRCGLRCYRQDQNRALGGRWQSERRKMLHAC